MKKNLLYIFADQWGANSIGFNNPQIKTPNMDAFAKDCFQFTNAVSTYPLCSPHRAALITGKYPYSCGFWTNCKIGLDEVIMLKPQEITLSDVLHKAGYENSYIGKWHLDGSDLNFYKNPESGCENWDAFTPAGERRHNIDYWFSYGAMDNHLKPHYWTDESPQKTMCDKWSPELETDVAINYLENILDKSKPFNMMLSWNPPHPPYDQVPDKYYSAVKDRELSFRENVPTELRSNPDYLTKHKQYIAAIEGLDENFGRIISYLKQNNLYDSTIIVLSADHGDCMGSHGLYGKNVWYDESIKIPLLVKCGKTGESDALLSSQDHMPTLLELLQIGIPDTVQGISFAKLIDGEEINQPKEAFLCMIPGMPEVVDTFRKKGYNCKSFGWRGLRTKTHTYVVNNGNKLGEKQTKLLYDNVNDPYQQSPKQLSDAECRQWDDTLSKYLQLTNDPFIINFDN